jgi:hypothetical protein
MRAALSPFVVHDEDGMTTMIGAQGGPTRTVSLSRAARPTVILGRAESAPTQVTLDGKALAVAASRADVIATGGYLFDAGTHTLWVHVPAGAGNHLVAY